MRQARTLPVVFAPVIVHAWQCQLATPSLSFCVCVHVHACTHAGLVYYFSGHVISGLNRYFQLPHYLHFTEHSRLGGATAGNSKSPNKTGQDENGQTDRK